MQRLLNAAAWETGGVRDDVRAYVAGHLGARMAIRARWYSGGAMCPGAGG